MLESRFYWRNREIRRQINVIDGIDSPSLLLKNGVYLNAVTKKWIKANIWVVNDRIVYVGDQLPKRTDTTEIVDCEGKYLVPGYVEPHANPFLLYNPESFARHAAKFGTTTLLNDNLMLHFLTNKKKAFTLVERLLEFPMSMYWNARFVPQTALQENFTDSFNTEDILDWLEHPGVVQAGGCYNWRNLLEGNDRLLYWVQEAKHLHKPVRAFHTENSDKVLGKMKIVGIEGDNESKTMRDIKKRLQLGFQVGVYYSAEHPNLPEVLDEIIESGEDVFSHLTMTTDGSVPSFYENGVMNQLIEIAIKKGVPIADAYRMGSYNTAVNFNLENKIGSIAPGRIAHINILEEKENPNPIGVLAKGKWLVKDGEDQMPQDNVIDWEEYGLKTPAFNWELTEGDFQFSAPIGLHMIDDEKIKPYVISTNILRETLPDSKPETFLILIDKEGEWRVNTIVRGFTNRLGAMVSSYSLTGDIILTGKNKKDIELAWQRMKEIGGGIVLAHEGEIILEIPLQIGGFMFDGPMEELIVKEKQLNDVLREYGCVLDHPVNILFRLSATNLPYVRVTQQGIMDIKRDNILLPATMR